MVRLPRMIVAPCSIRRMLAWVALAALASFGLAKYLESREFAARAGPSEKLLRPIIQFHESGLSSDLACWSSNRESAMGHLRRMRGHLVLAFKAIRHDLALPRARPYSSRYRMPARNSLGTARGEWRGFELSIRLVAKQQIMARYHARLIGYYEDLLAEHRVVIPPLPEDMEAERRSLTDLLRQVCNDPKLELDPEPLPQFLPGWKPPPGYRNTMTGDSL